MKKYISKYSNGKNVSPAQFIAEMACERIAKKNKKDLHYRFWLSEEWTKEYKGQIAAANKLLTEYEAPVIIQALISIQGQKIYSLRAPHLRDIIEKTKGFMSQKDVVDNNPIQRNFLNRGKINHKTNNILDKLKDIDNGSSPG